MKRPDLLTLVTLLFLAPIGAARADSVEITSPHSGDVWTLGETREINWRFTGADPDSRRWTIQLLRRGAAVGTVATRVAGYSFRWTVGDYRGGTAAAGDNYTLRVTNQARTVTDTSDVVTLAAPGGTEPRADLRLPPHWDDMQARPPPRHRLPPQAAETRTRPRVAPARADYRVESLELRNFRSGAVFSINNELRVPYNGVETTGTVVARVRWNGSPPPANCSVWVEFTQRYLSSERGPRPITLGQFAAAAFNANGIAEVSAPITIRGGERDGAKVNIQAALIFSGAVADLRTCDAQPTRNSLAYNFTLQRFAAANDLALRLEPDDLGVHRIVTSGDVLGAVTGADRMAPTSNAYRLEHRVRVRNLATEPVGPLSHVQGRAYILWYNEVTGDYRRPTDPPYCREHPLSCHPGIEFTVASVTQDDWTMKPIEFRFHAPANYWRDILLVVEIDPQNATSDTRRSNNRVDQRFRISDLSP